MINELIAWIKKSKKEALLFKVDFNKAFDSLHWPFLRSVMEQLGFPPIWNQWIMGCLKSSRTLVLVNGSTTNEFSVGKGVRQGDPLAPFLFVLAMEALNSVMTKACSMGLFRDILTPNAGPLLSHLFYADDALFIGEWSKINLLNLARILRCFHLASGLKVNFSKSKVFGIGIPDNEVGDFAKILCCQPATLPFTYLGLPVGANMALIKHWQPVVERFKSRLSSWKARSLSFGGRITLINSVLGSLPLFYFSLFKAPLKIIADLEKIRRRFLWGGGDANKKICWISWDKVLTPKKSGGLGVISLRAANLALLGKWLWRLKSDASSLWARLVLSIHSSSRVWKFFPVRLDISGVWKNIVSISNDLNLCNINFMELCKKELGAGNGTYFWYEDWSGNGILKDIFPDLFQLESRKMCLVTDRYHANGGTIDWV